MYLSFRWHNNIGCRLRSVEASYTAYIYTSATQTDMSFLFMSSTAWGSLAWILNCYGMWIYSSLELGKLIIAYQREVSRRVTACIACFSCGRWFSWDVPIFISSPLDSLERFVVKTYNSKPPHSSSGTRWFPVLRSLCLDVHTCIEKSLSPLDYLHLQSVFTTVNI